MSEDMLTPGGGIYKAENFIFSPVFSLRSWRSQFSHLFLWRLRNQVYVAQMCISNDRAFPNTGVKVETLFDGSK